MADRTLFFDDLLTLPNLRAKTYTVHEAPGGGLTCLELAARRLEDWYYARRWIELNPGRRRLYWILDDVEGAGFRFLVAAHRRVPTADAPPGEPWETAQSAYARLDPDERRLHRELFPQEAELLSQGYDWDDGGVTVAGALLPRDAWGRTLESVDGILYEWVKVVDEWTWRRYPIGRIRRPRLPAVASPAPEAAAAD